MKNQHILDEKMITYNTIASYETWVSILSASLAIRFINIINISNFFCSVIQQFHHLLLRHVLNKTFGDQLRGMYA